jgi:hypothetical protein
MRGNAYVYFILQVEEGIPLEQVTNFQEVLDDIQDKLCELRLGVKPELWIRIDSVRIQHFSSIRIRFRIRIHKICESGSNAGPDPQRKI